MAKEFYLDRNGAQEQRRLSKKERRKGESECTWWGEREERRHKLRERNREREKEREIKREREKERER